MLTEREILLIIASTAIAIYIKENPSDSFLTEYSKDNLLTQLCDYLGNAAADKNHLAGLVSDTSLCEDYLSRWVNASYIAIATLTLGVTAFDVIPSLGYSLMEKIKTIMNPQDESVKLPNSRPCA